MCNMNYLKSRSWICQKKKKKEAHDKDKVVQCDLCEL